MRLALRAVDIAGYAFTNRFNIFIMPVVITAFLNMALRLPLPAEYYVMVFFTTACGYIFNIYTDYKEDSLNYEADYRIFHRDSPIIKPAIAISYLIGLILALRAGLWFTLYGGLFHVLSIGYSAPLRLRLGGRERCFRVKEITVVKNLYAALQWSTGLVLTPYFYLGEAPGATAALLIAVSFGLIYQIELSWDLRDIGGDTQTGVRTVPVVFGPAVAVRVLRIVHVTTCALAIWGVHAGLLPSAFQVVWLHAALGIVYLEWYATLSDKRLASHLLTVYAAAIMLVGLAWNELAVPAPLAASTASSITIAENGSR